MEKSGKRQNLLLIALMVAVLGMAVGFAAYTASLQITGSANFEKASWDIKFTSVTPASTNSSQTGTTAPVINTAGTQITFGLKLAPGDKYAFDAVVTNNGTFDAKLTSSSISPAVATTYGTSFYTFKVTYDGTACSGTNCSAKHNDVIAKNGGTKTVHVEIAYPVLAAADVDQYPVDADGEDVTFTINLGYTDASS